MILLYTPETCNRSIFSEIQLYITMFSVEVHYVGKKGEKKAKTDE